MTLRARILLIVLGVLPLTFTLIVIGITQEVLHAKQAAQEMRRLLIIEAAERIYSADLRSALRGFPPEISPISLGTVIDLLDRRQSEQASDRLLSSWAIFWADGQVASVSSRGESSDVIRDDPQARQAALESDRPIAAGELVWRRLEFGAGAEARTVGVIAMRFEFDLSSFDLLRQLRLIIAISVLGTVTLATLLLLVLGRQVVRPVDRLAEAARRVRAGDYDHRVRPMGRSDELAHFVEVFNDMVASVRDHNNLLQAKVAEATEQVRATEKRLAVASRLAATGRLAAEIAHEINNPVGGMINAARTLKGKFEKGTLDATKAIDYLELILDGLSRVERTVKEVLLFARREVRAQPFDMHGPIERALSLVRHRAGARGIDLRTTIAPAIPQVFGDAGEMQQVLINLLLNAIDATPRGGIVALEVKALGTGEEVEVVVADTGTGMTAEVREHAFDPFFTTKPEGEGTGIGLAIVYNIISSHGGEIAIESEPGAGSTIRIRLPTHAEIEPPVA